MKTTNHSFATIGSTAASLVTILMTLLCLQVRAAQFEDVTVAAGVTNAPGYCLSAAWGDYNNDQLIDLYLAIGADTTATNALFRNNGNGTFTRIGAAVGPIATDRHDSQSCAWIDFNNDGYRDMFVVNGGWALSRNDFYWNNGDGTFRRGNVGNLTQLSRYRGWSACGDWNGDGWVDIHVGEGDANSMWGPYPNCIYQATGLDTFIPVDFAPAEGYVNAGVFGDCDNDGDVDLFLSCYSSPSRLWRNDGGGHATALANGLPTGGDTAHAAWADYDNDGDLDIALGGSANISFYRNDGTTGFTLAASFASSIAWGAWADYDNDGHLDFLSACGQGTPRKASLFHNNGDGTFTKVEDSFTLTAQNWLTSPWGDFDNDGFMDVILTHQYGQHRLYHNLGRASGNTNHWIKFKLVGAASNRDAIGAKVRVLATIGGQSVWQMQEVNGGYAMQNDTRLNFGLGDAAMVERVRIEWPSGNVQELPGQTADRIVTVTEQVYIAPIRPTASLGGSVTLTSQRVGSWQWYHDGVLLAGQTNQTLNLSNLQLADAGRYSVVTSSGGIFYTNFVHLFVDTQFTRITEGSIVTDNEDSFGCTWVDYDQDGDIDLYVVNGLFVGGQKNALYRNEGNGAFLRMTSATAGAIVNDAGGWGQAAWADYDNDGLPDAVVEGYPGTALYRNLGQGMFQRRLDLVPASWPLGSGPFFADIDNDGWVDWFVGSAVAGLGHNSLFHNLRGQSIHLETTGPVVTDALSNTEGSAWGDYDGDGDLDLLLTLGSLSPGVRLYENLGRGSFRRASTVGLEVSLGSGAYAGSAAWADYDNDSRLDLFVVVYNSTTNALFHDEGNGVFTRRLMGKAGQQCHPAWADYDNDGWLDLFLARGQTVNELSQLWHNNGDGTFTEIATGSLVSEPARSQGAAWGDYDNDGFMDLFAARGYVNGRNALYRNNGNSNAWLKVNLLGITSNRSAIGAKVKVRAYINGKTIWQMREVPGGNRCQDDLRANFGLGNATAAQVLRIEWPSGITEEFYNVPVRRILTIVEPSLRGYLAPDGKFHVVMTMSTNRVYQLQTSADLVTWTTLTNCTGSGSCEPVEYVDPEAPSAGTSRFYRMK